MSGRISVSYLSNDRLVKEADKLLEELNPENTIPIPIEEIVELKIGIRVIPVPSLFENLGVDSYITSDFKYIIIDQYRYENMEERTRFTYAHELSHYLLHTEIYKSANISSSEDYIKFQNSLDRETEKRIELQSYILASYLLMPKSQFRKFVDEFISNIGKQNITVNDIHTLILKISDKFQVSAECALKHLQYEYKDLLKGIWSP